MSLAEDIVVLNYDLLKKTALEVPTVLERNWRAFKQKRFEKKYAHLPEAIILQPKHEPLMLRAELGWMLAEFDDKHICIHCNNFITEEEIKQHCMQIVNPAPLIIEILGRIYPTNHSLGLPPDPIYWDALWD
jgi:hypothetical protein